MMDVYYIQKPNELYHYGVKGMKWGVRHDKKHQQRDRISLSDKQKIILKYGVASAATALAIYGGYRLYKATGYKPSSMSSYGYDEPLKNLIDRYPANDLTIKSKTVLQRVSKDSFEDFRDRGYTYVSYKFRDNMRYKSGFRKEINRSGSLDFVHKIRPKTDLKIASPRTVAKEYLRLYPEGKDNTFRMIMNPYNASRYSGDELSRHISKTQTKVFESLKQKGYSGFVDIEDASKLKNSSPLIIFEPDQYLSVKKSRRIGMVETFVADILK